MIFIIIGNLAGCGLILCFRELFSGVQCSEKGKLCCSAYSKRDSKW